MSVPATAAELTPEWLTAALAAGGVLGEGRVVEARWDRLGADFGFTGVVGRLRLRYGDGARGDPPSSLVAKLPLADDDAPSGFRARLRRDPGLRERHYERSAREARFYRELAPEFAPRPYYADDDAERRRVVLLLEDLSDGRQGDVLAGCSVDEAARVLEALAPFHARWWGERAPARAYPRPGADALARQERYDAQVDRVVAEYGEGLPRAARRILVRLRSRLAAVVEALHERPRTLIHGDLHLDNVLFDAGRGRRPVVVLDWQTVSVGPPAIDVALFLFGSLSVNDRRSAEADLLALYAGCLARHGVTGYPAEDVRRDCGLALLLLLAGTVGWLAAGNDEELSARERALRRAALADGRLVSAVVDHDR